VETTHRWTINRSKVWWEPCVSTTPVGSVDVTHACVRQHAFSLISQQECCLICLWQRHPSYLTFLDIFHYLYSKHSSTCLVPDYAMFLHSGLSVTDTTNRCCWIRASGCPLYITLTHTLIWVYTVLWEHTTANSLGRGRLSYGHGSHKICTSGSRYVHTVWLCGSQIWLCICSHDIGCMGHKICSKYHYTILYWLWYLHLILAVWVKRWAADIFTMAILQNPYKLNQNPMEIITVCWSQICKEFIYWAVITKSILLFR